MSRKQIHTLDAAYKKLITFFDARGRLPSITEMLVLFKYKSRNSAFVLIERMVKAKLIDKDKLGKISLRHERREPPLRKLGTVPAGFASPVDEALSDTLSLSDYLIRNKEASYVLEVQGDSMKDAGIHDGDMVIFERTDSYKVGDVVVAAIEDGYTLKYLQRDPASKGGRYYLEPANPAYPRMYPIEGQIAGVVVATFRKYK